MDNSVITPSYNMLPYLKRCAASVSDQRGVSVEHLVVDGGSTDGTREWLAAAPGIVSVSEKDRGMYDAINKGLRLASGDILSYLSCDEQYLPGTLHWVQGYLDAHPEVDVLFGDILLVDPQGRLLAFRRGYPLRLSYLLASFLYVYACSMFFRRRLVDDGMRFDAGFKDIGDWDFVVRLVRKGYRIRHVRRYFAAFTLTGRNMSAGENARRERERSWRRAPLWIRFAHPLVNAVRLIEKALRWGYFQRWPLEYALYAGSDCRTRSVFRSEGATFRWPRRS